MSNSTLSHCIDTDTGSLLLPYGLGTLSPEECQRFGDHLLQCEVCQAELNATDELLRSLAMNRQELVKRWKVGGQDFASRIRAASTDPRVKTGRRNSNANVYIWSAVALAACIVLFIVWRTSTYSSADDITATPADTLVAGDTELDKTTDQHVDTTKIRLDQALRNQEQLARLATKAPLPYAMVSPRGNADQQAEFERAMAGYQKGNYADAVAQLREYTAKVPESEPLLYLGTSEYMAGVFRESITTLNKAEQANPRTTRLAQIRWFRANAYLALGDLSSSLNDLRRVEQAKTAFAEEAAQLRSRIETSTAQN